MGCVEVDRVFALPLQKDTDLIAVPLNAKIKLQRAKNMEQLEHFIEYSRFLEKAQRLLADARDRLQIVDLKLSEKEKKDSKSSSSRKLPIVVSAGLENGYVLRKSASLDSNKYQQLSNNNTIADEYNEIDHIYDYVRGLTPLSKGLNRFEPICESTIKSQPDSGNYSSLIRVSSSSNNISNNNSSSNNNNNNGSSSNNNSNTNNNNNNNSNSNNNSSNNNNNNNNYSSLDSSKHNSHHSQHNHHHYHHHHNHYQQQQSLQQSPPPLPPQLSHLQPHFNHSHIQEDIKPVPPPIETIPSKKLPEKRQRPTLPKLYVKNSSSSSSNHHPKVITNNTTVNGNSPVAAINGKESLEPQSPLFHIR